MAFPVPAVEAINDAARKNAFDIEAIPWKTGIDRSLFWGPESMSHLYYCPSYQLLTEDERRYYNQVHACGICEQFVFLEEVLLVRGIGRLLETMGARLPAPMREAMTTFVDEEIKHGEMFGRLLKMADPELYGRERWVVYKLSGYETGFMDACLKFPETFLWWIWLAVLFEEKTLDFYRKYKDAPDQARVDTLFHAVHKYHAKDEMRHFQLDHHFVEMFWVPAPRWKRWINEKVFHRMMYSFTHPRRTVRHALDRLLLKFPRLEAHREQLSGEVLTVYTRKDWQEAFYSRDALPHTFALFDRFPELHGLTDAFPLYEPPCSSST